jgi:predicted CXXCH cytochrome family protein
MNRERFLRIILAGMALILPVKEAGSQPLSSGDPLTGFTTSDEYMTHIKGETSCIGGQCHAQFTAEENRFGHEPADNGDCRACHIAEEYPNKYGLEPDQSIACYRCHRNIERKVRSSRFVHGPIKSGDCTSCHDPHGSGREFLLRTSYGNMCSLCHNLPGFFDGEFTHQPVKDGNCGLCHDPHASDYESRLTDVGANLCIVCHEDMVEGMTGGYVHDPLVKSGCTDCHDPHSGDNVLRLKDPTGKICFRCHEEKRNEIDQYVLKHEPAIKGQCTSCHSPHFSKNQYLLVDRIDDLCYSCHKDNRVWRERRFQHGPVAQGNCPACHNPHGSDNAYILRMSFPHRFYAPYEKGIYSLCFLCHKEALATVEKTETVTNFRNGEVNLHRLHVNRKKGRTCRACHDVHASDQEDHLREKFPFGSVDIPLYYVKTETGGRCIPGCHKERGYDRVNMVENIK